MKQQTEGITELLLEVSAQEFIEKGYAGVSLREIAQKCNISTSTIYTRFVNKQGLLQAIINPVIEEIKTTILKMLDDYMGQVDDVKIKTMVAQSKLGNHVLIDMIYDHYSIFKLLMLMPIESKRAEVIDSLAEIGTEDTLQFAEQINSDVFTSGKMTPILLHIICTAYYEGILETVAHDMSREEAHQYVENLSMFFNRGWAGTFGVPYE